MIRVLLADDHAAIRAGLRMVLDAAPDIEVVGEAGDGSVAVRQATALRPDVVVMDIRMPGTDGIEATRAITSAGLADVLIFTTFDIDEYVFGALRAGAAGFLLKSVEPGALIAAIRSVAAGDGVVAPEVTRRLLHAFAAIPGPHARRRPGPHRPDRPRARGPRRPRPGAVQRPPGRALRHQRGHRQDPRLARAGQARLHLPRTGRDRGPRGGSHLAPLQVPQPGSRPNAAIRRSCGSSLSVVTRGPITSVDR